jgi:hypothetical protein
MNANLIIESLVNRKGQHVCVTWRRQLETRKGCTLVIEKETRAYVRAGIDYANLKSVREGIAQGTREEVQPLPDWCEWIQFPFTLRHKSKGTEYVRLYPSTFGNLKPSVRYYVNGLEARAEDVEPLCLAKEFRDRDDVPACFMVKVDSISEVSE